ncbi:MAG: tRNA(Ile)(2)-agmatinylcytidine synthase [Natronomonas sp.]
MTIIGLDDTDARDAGMCTTYVADRIAREVGATQLVLLRCNPAVEHKTRGNAALAVHTTADPEAAFETACSIVDRVAADSEETNPGVVVAETIDDATADFCRRAVTDHCSRRRARDICRSAGHRHRGFGNGRGVIGALAAVGADRAVEEWTYERITYRRRERWGTDREVDPESVFEAAATAYPTVWDTVDREAGELVCVPHTPGPVLYGIRGDDPGACEAVAAEIDSESVAAARTFRTNQGTDAHLRDGSIRDASDGYSYRLDGTVSEPPETRRGGHVFFELDETLQCAAFEPTKRFRDHVRSLRVGDELTVCGEVSDGTLKLEKFAVRSLRRTELVTPTCPDCGTRMSSAGRDQGYRCRDCDTAAERVERSIDRDLEIGWYEVPPRARRHIAKPLVRGGFDLPTHPER